MNFPTLSSLSKHEQTSSSSTSSISPFLQVQQAFTTCSSFLNNFSSSFTTHLNIHLTNFASSSLKSHAFAKIPPLTTYPQKIDEQQPQFLPQIQQNNNSNKNNSGMSNEAIEERLAGVPVYALSNYDEEFVLISSKKTKSSIGLFCFKKEDAEVLLEQMRSIDPNMRRGSSVVPVALNKVFQLRVNGVAFRLIPDTSQVKNALKEREKAGLTDEEFFGVPVFQSRSLILSSNKKRYRPVFFRKEDLENSLSRASKQQGKLNPLLRQGDIQVAILEDIIKGMKDDSSQVWDDVVFIPPGLDLLTEPSQFRES